MILLGVENYNQKTNFKEMVQHNQDWSCKNQQLMPYIALHAFVFVFNSGAHFTR